MLILNLLQKTFCQEKSFYKRKLPSNLIRLTSNFGKQLLKQSIQTGYAQSFPHLIQQFVTQQQPSTCGPASLALILNTLEVDPGKNWKGIWRWYDDKNLKGITEEQLKKGITIEEWHYIAKQNNLKSIYFHPETKQKFIDNNIHLKKFMADQSIIDCIKCCTRRANLFLTVNYSRKLLNQTGSGHFSPIAAYNEKNDMVLMLDVAKFKYPIYWCTTTQLIASLKQIDKDTKLPRGIILNSKLHQSHSIICDWQCDLILLEIIKKSKLSKIQLLNIHLHSLIIPFLFDLTILRENKSFDLTKQIVKFDIDIEFLRNEHMLKLLEGFGYNLQLEQNIIIYLAYACVQGIDIKRQIKNLSLIKIFNKLKLYLHFYFN